MALTDVQKEALRKAVLRVDIESYLEATFDRVIPSGQSELRVDCFAPNGCAGSDEKGHLWVNKDKRVWICYKCGYGDPSQQKGTSWLPRFMADAEGTHISKIIDRLLKTYEVVPEEDLGEILERLFDPDEDNDMQTQVPIMEMPRQFHELCGSRGYSAQKFIAYAEQRGFGHDEQGLHNLLYCVTGVPTLPEKYRSTFVNRLIWPVYDAEGNLRSAVARDILGSKSRPKWVNWPDTEPSNYFWPMGRFVPGQGWFPNSLPKTVVLAEGIINAYAIERLSSFVARACFGKKISDAQIDILQRERVQRVILAWDFDAKDKIMQAARRLSTNFEVEVFPYRHPAWALNLDFDDATDPDSPIHAEVQKDLATAIGVDSPEFCKWINEEQKNEVHLEGL